MLFLYYFFIYLSVPSLLFLHSSYISPPYSRPHHSRIFTHSRPRLDSFIVFSGRLLQITSVTTFLFSPLPSTTICWSNSQSPSTNFSNFLFRLGPGPAKRQYIAALIRLVDPRDPRPRSLP
ncbi:hypothetical protein BDW71DRAFT_74517 [Aspergillus fruticulosus]